MPTPVSVGPVVLVVAVEVVVGSPTVVDVGGAVVVVVTSDVVALTGVGATSPLPEHAARTTAAEIRKAGRRRGDLRAIRPWSHFRQLFPPE